MSKTEKPLRPTKPYPYERPSNWVSDEERIKMFWDSVDKSDPDGCWPYKGKGDGGIGYQATGWRGKTVGAYRVAYELVYGEIPDGYHLDHLCHTRAVERGECLDRGKCPHRACVRPDHLEPVTPAENIRRGMSTYKAQNKTHCSSGHEYTEENTRIDKKGYKVCLTCTRNDGRNRYRQRLGREPRPYTRTKS